MCQIYCLRDIKAEEILTPRTVTHMLDESVTVEFALNEPKTRQFSRIPGAGSSDNITGKVYYVDLLEAACDGRNDQPINELVKPIFRVSKKLSVQKLLDMFIKQRTLIFSGR